MSTATSAAPQPVSPSSRALRTRVVVEDAAAENAGGKWRGLAQPVRGFSPRAIWTHIHHEGQLETEEVFQFTELFKATQFWKSRTFRDEYSGEVVDSLYNIARELLQWRMKLQIVLRVARVRRGFVSRKIMTRPTELAFMGSPLFAAWPADAVARMFNAIRPHAFDAGEYAIHEGEPGTSGLVIAVQGTFDELVSELAPATDTSAESPPVTPRLGGGLPGGVKVRPRRERVLRLLESHVVTPASKAKFFGDLVQVTGERHSTSIVTATPCDAWVLPTAAIMREFQSLSEDVRQQTFSKVLESRCQHVRTTLPVTPKLLRESSPIFANATDADLRQVIDKLHPKPVQRGEHVYQQNAPSPCCYVLRHGLLSDTAGNLIMPVMTFGEQEMLFKERRRGTVTAVEVSYYYQLTYSDFYAIPSLLRTASHAATERQRRDMCRDVLVRSLARCPLFETSPLSIRREVAPLFTPVVYMANELITSGSQDVECMLLITAGTAKVRGLDANAFPGEDIVRIGESLGYTGLVPQRWTYPIVASTVVELWTLDFGALVEYLMATGLLQKFVKLSKQLHDYAPTNIKRVSTAVADQQRKGSVKFQTTVNQVASAANVSIPTINSSVRRGTHSSQHMVRPMGYSIWRRCPLSTKAVRKLARGGPGGQGGKLGGSGDHHRPGGAAAAASTSPHINPTTPPQGLDTITQSLRMKKAGSIKPSRALSLLRARAADGTIGKVQHVYHNFQVQSKQYREACDAELSCFGTPDGYIQVTTELCPVRAVPVAPRQGGGHHGGGGSAGGSARHTSRPPPREASRGARPATAGCLRPRSNVSPSTDPAAAQRDCHAATPQPMLPAAQLDDDDDDGDGDGDDASSRDEGDANAAACCPADRPRYRLNRHGRTPDFTLRPARPPSAPPLAVLMSADDAAWDAFGKWAGWKSASAAAAAATADTAPVAAATPVVPCPPVRAQSAGARRGGRARSRLLMCDG